MNIYIIGYRGTGKTTVSELLAMRLGRKYISTDGLVIKKLDIPISQFVELDGWEAFREIEEDVFEEIGRLDNSVVDCGGGIIESPKNRDILKSGKVILLTAEIETIIKRIKQEKDRPPLTSGKSLTEEVEEVISKRDSLYKEVANLIVDTTTKTPEEVVQEILQLTQSL